jgi:hypothetical protein
MEGFRIENVLVEFINKLKTIRPELSSVLDAEYSVVDSAKESAFFAETCRPLAMEFIKRDESIWSVPRFFLRGVDFSTFYNDLNSRDKDTVWDFLRTSLVSSYIGDDWMKSLKDIWSKYTGKESSEIDEVLNDTTTKSNIEELFEFFKETRIFKLGMEMLETLKIEQFGIDGLDFSDPSKILELLKNPDNPIMKKAVSVVGGFVENKIKQGSLRKEDLVSELEMLREKFKHSLGKIFQEGIFGEAPREGQRAEVLLSSSPDARRARMMARLQRKVQEKKP